MRALGLETEAFSLDAAKKQRRPKATAPGLRDNDSPK